MSEADSNVDDNQSHQEWTEAKGRKSKELNVASKLRPGRDGRVCRVVDGTDGKQEESSADHLERES